MGVEGVDGVSKGGSVVRGSPFSSSIDVVGTEEGVSKGVDGGSVVTGYPLSSFIDVGGTEEEESRSFSVVKEF